MKRVTVVAATLLWVGAFFGSATVRAATSFDQARFNQYVEKARASNGIPGIAVAVVDPTSTIETKGFGTADDSGRQVTADTPFPIGSLTKAFTATAVLQLVEQKKVSLDHPVHEYLPQFTMADSRSAKITIRELLNQTSGIPEDLGMPPLAYFDASYDRSLDAFVRSLSAGQLDFDPGTQYQYSNTNYSILGDLIEVVTGQQYSAYVTQQILLPLNMTKTFFTEKDATAHGVAQGHTIVFGTTQSTPFHIPPQLLSAGYMISTATDVAQFLSMNLNNGAYMGNHVLSPESVALLHTPPTVSGSTYAMGWIKATVLETDVLVHDGAVPNFYSTMMLAPKQHLGVIVLTNQQTPISLLLDPQEQIALAAMKIANGEATGALPGIPVVLDILYGVLLITLGFEIFLVIRVVKRRGRLRPGRRWLRIPRAVLGFLVNVVFAYLFLAAVLSLGYLWRATPDFGLFELLIGLSGVLFCGFRIWALGARVWGRIRPRRAVTPSA